MPGLYELLPSYRCVPEAGTTRRLGVADVVAIGGDAELAAGPLGRTPSADAPSGRLLRPFVGVDQPTMQNLVIRDGVVEPLFHTVETGSDGSVRSVDYSGDSTVYRKAAVHGRGDASYVPQTHTALARTDEAIAFVRTVLTEGELRPPLPSANPVGIDVPDVVGAGVPFEIRVVTLTDPAAVSCLIVEIGSNRPLVPPRMRSGDGMVLATATVDRPGIYRVEVKAGGYSAVSQLVLAVPPAALAGTD
jgi:hypothetical protein